MALEFQPNVAAALLREIVVSMVRRDDPGLSVHQLAVFLSCYLGDGEQTVRDLAQEMGASKASVTRAFDKLVERGLLSRETDKIDGRTVYAGQTEAGAALLAEFGDVAGAFIKETDARAA